MKHLWAGVNPIPKRANLCTAVEGLGVLGCEMEESEQRGQLGLEQPERPAHTHMLDLRLAQRTRWAGLLGGERA